MSVPKPIQLTVAVPYSEDRVLLGRKKKGLGAGYWNGFGGKVEPGETLEAASAREVEEEIGVMVHTQSHVGLLNVRYDDKVELAHGLSKQEPEVAADLHIHIFRVEEFVGEPRESDEMEPQWFSVDSLPYDLMWPSDQHWWPFFLANQPFVFTGHFRDRKTLLSYTVKEVAHVL